MPFFVALPVITYNQKEQEVTGKQADECELIEVQRYVDLFWIESYQEAIPASDFREDNKIWTQVVMHSGDNFIVNMSLKNFHSLLKSNNII